MLPKGWRFAELGDLLAGIEAGTSVNSEDRRAQPGEVAVLKTSAAFGGRFLADKHKVVTDADRRRVSCPVRADTILLSRMNTKELVGESGYVGEDHPHLFLPDRLWALTAKPTISTRWLSHLLASPMMRGRLGQRATGTSGSMKNISQEALLDITIELPSPPEQRRIAAVLDAWDAAIATAERLLARTAQRDEALSRRVFFRGEPGASHAAFAIGNLATVIRGVNYDPGSDVGDDVAVLTAAHIQQGRVGYAPTSVKVAAQVVNESQLLRQGDVAICMSNGSKHLVGKAALVTDEPPRAAFGAFCATCRPRGSFERRLLAHALNSDRYRELLHVELAGSAIGNLAPNALSGFRFGWTGNATDLDVLDTSKQDLDTATLLAERIRHQKRGLMQQLLTGRLRVPESIDALLPSPPALDAAA